MTRKSRPRRGSSAPFSEWERRRRQRKSRALLPYGEGLEGRWCPSQAAIVPAAAQAGSVQSYGQLPLAFEPNRGQADAWADYVAHGSGYTLWLSQGDAVLDLGPPAAPSGGATAASASAADAVLRMHLVGSAAPTSSEGSDPLPGQSDYFFGSDPSAWLTGVPQYARVEYHDAYPGIDVTYHGTNAHQLEYDFDLARGPTPARLISRSTVPRRSRSTPRES